MVHPDGITSDEYGNLYLTGRSALWIVSPDGLQLDVIPFSPSCTNAVFGGPEGKTLYITGQSTVWSLETTVRGIEWLDRLPPVPVLSAWYKPPAAVDSSSITMTAVTASDSSGVEYYFGNLTDASHSSGWVSSAVYTDKGLAPQTQYTYRVRVRDKSVFHNMTQWSVSASAVTAAAATTKQTGDADGNGIVNIIDALMTAQYAVGIIPDPFYREAADVTGCDGNINIVDALTIAQYSVGIITRFSCEA